MFAVAELVLIGYDCITNIHCFNEMKAIILMVITLSYTYFLTTQVLFHQT